VVNSILDKARDIWKPVSDWWNNINWPLTWARFLQGYYTLMIGLCYALMLVGAAVAIALLVWGIFCAIEVIIFVLGDLGILGLIGSALWWLFRFFWTYREHLLPHIHPPEEPLVPPGKEY